eukprot:403375009
MQYNYEEPPQGVNVPLLNPYQVNQPPHQNLQPQQHLPPQQQLYTEEQLKIALLEAKLENVEKSKQAPNGVDPNMMMMMMLQQQQTNTAQVAIVAAAKPPTVINNNNNNNNNFAPAPVAAPPLCPHDWQNQVNPIQCLCAIFYCISFCIPACYDQKCRRCGAISKSTCFNF